MPFPTLTELSGEDIDELIDSLEKQRKELQWLLQSLDTSNVKELNAEVINAGTINGDRLIIDDTVTFANGYDPTIVKSEIQTQLTVITGQIQLKVSQADFNALGQRVSFNEASITVQANQIESKVSETDYNGNTIASLINQSSTTVTILASKIQLIGYVTIGDLNNPGAVVINEGNIYGTSFTVGRGTSSTLSMYASRGSHRIYSEDAAGFRIQSNGTLSLQADNGTIYANSKFWARDNFQVTGFSELEDVDAHSVNASEMTIGGFEPVATQRWVADNDFASENDLDDAIRQLEIDIVSWANDRFQLKS